MPMDVYKLYYTGTASVDAAASLDLQSDLVIVAMHLNLSVGSADALNEGVACEISFASTSGFSSNDTKSSIIGGATYQNFLTTGGALPGSPIVVSGVAIPGAAGERMYLHTKVLGGAVTFYCSCWLYTMVGSMPRTTPGRRRRL